MRVSQKPYTKIRRHLFTWHSCMRYWTCSCMRSTHATKCLCIQWTTNCEQPMNWAHDDTDVMPRYEFMSCWLNCQCLCDRRNWDIQRAGVCASLNSLTIHVHRKSMFIWLHLIWLLGDSHREKRLPTWKSNVTTDKLCGNSTIETVCILCACERVWSLCEWVYVYVSM